MAAEEHLSFKFQGILNEFTRVRDAYVALKAYCDAQEEMLAVEKERSGRMKENVEKLSQAYVLLEKRYKSTVDELKAEAEDLRKTIKDLKEQCNHLRLINAVRNENDEELRNLQDEIEVLKAQLVVQEEKHREDVAVLKQQHSDEILRHKVLLQTAKQDAATSQCKKTNQPKNAGKNKKNSAFFRHQSERWPELDISIVSKTHAANEEETENTNGRNKRRKLFHEDKDTVIDLE